MDEQIEPSDFKEPKMLQAQSVQFAVESDSLPAKSKYPKSQELHFSPMYPLAHLHAPLESQGHGSADVQAEPSSFKEPLM